MIRKSFTKVNQKGTVTKTIREHYLRDDIACGVESCAKCLEILNVYPSIPTLLNPLEDPTVNTKLPKKSILLLPDTNILLHHLDIFESSKLKNVVILQTVLDEVRNLNSGIYNKIRAIISQPTKRFFVFSNEFHRAVHVEKLAGESENDRNDRAIRNAARWYQEHLDGTVDIVLLTNDALNREKALAEGHRLTFALTDFINGYGDATLMDVLESTRLEDVDEREHKMDIDYAEHLTPAALHSGIKEGRLYQGTLHCSHYNAFEGSISTSILSTITISGRKHMNRAINGDTIVVELLPKEEWDVVESVDREDLEINDSAIAATEEETAPVQSSLGLTPKGKVVGIIRRTGRTFCGSIDRRSVRPRVPMQSVIFIAMDRRIPRMRIRTRQAEHLAGQRVIVAVDEWSIGSKYPTGHLVKQLGEAGDTGTETMAILLEHDVAHQEFTPAVLACLPCEQWQPTLDDYQKRADFRELCICSVDPPGCTDIDDALHARSIPGSDLVEVGVHIADVTHFVQHGSPLDKEASARATTVYLVDRRIDMLPGLLGTNLCSLKSGVERLAFSVIWEMTLTAQVKSVRFTKSVISSKASLTYDQAQARLDDPHAADPISASLKTLNFLAKQLKEKRMSNGALTLASPEVRFSIDRETMSPTDVEMKEMKDANSMVEEFMLLANIHVAEELFKSFPENALLRRHPSPPPDNFKSLNAALQALGQTPLDVSSSKALAISLDRIDGDPFLNKLVRIMTTRCMLQAVYFASGTQPYDQFWHYGLACPIYTHFTSPIRRYADIVVHRLLAACIDWMAPASISWTKQDLDDVCHNLNYRNRMSQQAQRSSVELFTHLYFKEKTVEEDAFVIKVMQNGFVCFLPSFGIEGVISVDKADWMFDAEHSLFSLASTQQPVIYLFQRVRVKAVVDENAATGRPKLKFQLLDICPLPRSTSPLGKRKIEQ